MNAEMNPEIDDYLVDGCMRCNLGGTPECKVNNWKEELVALRRIILDCGVTEELKWGAPCYTYQGKNILMMSALKGFANISFFKGSLLEDPEEILTAPGPNSQAARYIKISEVEQAIQMERHIKAYIFEAIEVEKAGLQVQFKKNPEPIPDELQLKMEEDPIFKNAFESLTPGRQRGYILHFSQPKQSKTRVARIDKFTPMILNGEGMHDKYSSSKK